MTAAQRLAWPVPLGIRFVLTRRGRFRRRNQQTAAEPLFQPSFSGCLFSARHALKFEKEEREQNEVTKRKEVRGVKKPGAANHASSEVFGHSWEKKPTEKRHKGAKHSPKRQKRRGVFAPKKTGCGRQ
jgi:hypothetical protein